MAFSDTLEREILDHLFGLTTWTPPAHLWIGFSKADPLPDGSALDEPVGGGYARTQFDPGSARWLRTLGVVDNKSNITFLVTTGALGIVTHACLFTAASGGTPYLYWILDAPHDILVNTIMRFLTGDYNVT